MDGRIAADRGLRNSDGLTGSQTATDERSGSFESQGTAFLRSPARVRGNPGHLTLASKSDAIGVDRR